MIRELYSDLTRPIPCAKFAETNSFTQQMAHIMGEINEVWDAVTEYAAKQDEKTKDKVAEELTDVITSCRTALAMMDLSQLEVSAMQASVNIKNRDRGYWGEYKNVKK